MSKRSVGYYTEGLNNGVEVAVREDGVTFSREKYWNGRFFATSKWIRSEHFDEKVKGFPSAIALGFASRGKHIFVDTTRLRLPKEV